MIKHSIPDARGHIPELVEQVAAQGETVVLTMGANPIAALITLDDLARFEKMLAFDAIVECAADDADPNKVLIPMDEALAELRRLREQRSAG